MGKTRHLFKKIRDTKGAFHAKMGTIKGGNSMDLITMVSSLTQSHTPWNVKSSGPQEASV